MKPIQYPDAWLRLIGIPFLAILTAQFGASGPLWALLQTKQYYLDLLVHLLMVGVVWETNRSLIGQLDHRYSWTNHRLRRFLVQTGVALVRRCGRWPASSTCTTRSSRFVPKPSASRACWRLNCR
jgi:hypothetical protein